MKDIKSQMDRFTKKCNTRMVNTFRKSARIISENIAKLSPASTGTLIKSWSPAIGGIISKIDYGWESAWRDDGTKDEATGEKNKALALAALTPQIADTTNTLNIGDNYFFTNSVPYIAQAEYEGWTNVDPYHMRATAILEWETIVKGVTAIG